MQTIVDMFYWWYNDAGMPNGLKYTFFPVLFSTICFALYRAWKVGNNASELLALVGLSTMAVPIITLIVGLTMPLVLTVGLLFSTLFIVGKWGNNYRALEKSKEQRREEAIKTLLKSDPDLMDRYKDLMKESERILDDL